jgi:plasmid stability protein
MDSAPEEKDMGNLTVRKLDDTVIDRLKARARTRGHSLESELREILTQASRQPLILDALAEADRIAALTPSEKPQTENILRLQAGGER